MSERIRWLMTRCSRLLRRRQQESALQSELQFHFDQLIDEFRRQGMTDQQARQAAQREFGMADSYREEIRDTWRPPGLADAWRSVALAARSLVRTPGFTLMAIATLAIGIGANTAMFSVLNTVLLKPLPYPDAPQMEFIHRATPQNQRGPVSAAAYVELSTAAEAYGRIAAYGAADVSLSPPGVAAEFARAVRVSTNFFSVLGLGPALGRDLSPEDETAGPTRVAILSQRCWQSRFGGRPDILGLEVRIDGELHEVIGVLPEAFNEWRHLGWVDVFRPLALSPEQAADHDRHWLTVIARRHPAVSAADGAGWVAGVGARLNEINGELAETSAWRTVPLDMLRHGDTGGVALVMLIGLSGFVLLIACSNLANFLLARTMSRAREFAVRAALGASRAQLLRPLVVEAVLLALVGGMLAVVVALWINDWFTGRSTDDVGEQVVFLLDWSVLAWALVVSLLTALAFGLAPALYTLRLNLNETLKSGGRGTTGTRGHNRLRHLLIIGQFALAMALLTGAALFVHGLHTLNTHRQGWESDARVTATILLPSSEYGDAAAISAFHRAALARLESLPGVREVSLSNFLPFFTWRDPVTFTVPGQLAPVPGREPAAFVNSVTPDYFTTVGTRLLAGRVFSDQDHASAPPVALINERMARELFAGDPIGQRLARLGDAPDQAVQVIGVVQDVKSIFPEERAVSFQLYRPMEQQPVAYSEITVRVSGVAPAVMVSDVRQALGELNPDLPVRNLKPANERIARGNYQLAVLRDLLSAFAVLGLSLASIGIYGVIARLMAQRSSEFGLRLALGAQVHQITRLVLGLGVKLALAGAGAGLLGAFAVAALLRAAFPGMELPTGPVFVGATAFLILVALVACYLPARRASRINPVDALRAD